MSRSIVYLKAGQSVCIRQRKVKIKDIAKVYCSDPELTVKVENVVLFVFPDEKAGRKVVSVMKIIEEIKKVCKEAEICSIGEPDLLVYYRKPGHRKKWPEKLKMAAVCFTVFFGAGISIMGYNNDVDIMSIFNKIYYVTMGEAGPEANFMHLFYGVGILIGMMIFFNHASGKRLSDEPTPVEVQMRMYEKNVNSALILGGERKGEEIDVDT